MTVFIAHLLSFLDCNFKVIAVLKIVFVMKWMSSERAAMTVLPEMWGKLEESFHPRVTYVPCKSGLSFYLVVKIICP